MRGLFKSLACACVLTVTVGAFLALIPRAALAIEVSRHLQADARAAADAKKPLLLFVTQPGCPYCERARREVMRHLARDPAFTSRAIFREVSIGDTVDGFDGKPVSGLVVARSLGVRLYPTVVLVDSTGTSIASPLRGFSADFYVPSITSRIDEAEQSLRSRP